jgi:site-specific DNA-adenine methylase
MMPKKGRMYVEPFAGRGNVFWLAACVLDYREWWLNDPATAEWLEALKVCDLTKIPLNLREFDVKECAERASSGDPLALVMEAVANADGRSFSYKVIRSRGLEKGPRRRAFRSNQRYYSFNARCFANRVLNARRILSARKAHITARDYKRVLSKLGQSDFVYLDPPYLGVACDYTDDIDHVELLELLRGGRYQWLISGVDSVEYRRALGKPSRKKVRTLGQGTREKKSAPRMVECVWSNYL